MKKVAGGAGFRRFQLEMWILRWEVVVRVRGWLGLAGRWPEDIGVDEVVADEEERFAGLLRKRVCEAIAKVESGF